LLADRAIACNRLKIEAAIANARKIQELRGSHGSFAGWLDGHHPQPLADWVRLFRSTFRFTGGQIVGEFLISLGCLPGAHEPDCPVYDRIATLAPPWAAPPHGQETLTVAHEIGV
jgi:DNA-3-methyladenine glycosylase I